MASAGSKGLTKRHSARQKEHYKAHFFKIAANKLARLKRHVQRNENERRKKLARKGGAHREIKLDKQARKRLAELESQ